MWVFLLVGIGEVAENAVITYLLEIEVRQLATVNTSELLLQL